MPNEFKTLLTPSEGIFSESSSRFLAYAFPCADENFIKTKKQELKKQHHKAVHVVHALRLCEDGAIERSSDDGEPSGSAGKPVLNELKSRELTNIAVFVVRYFGGKKLGVPGLIHAYRTATANALEHAKIETHSIREFYNLMCTESEMNPILHLIHQSGASLETMEYGETCKFVISVKRIDKEQIISKLSANRKIKIEFLYSA